MRSWTTKHVSLWKRFWRGSSLKWSTWSRPTWMKMYENPFEIYFISPPHWSSAQLSHLLLFKLFPFCFILSAPLWSYLFTLIALVGCAVFVIDFQITSDVHCCKHHLGVWALDTHRETVVQFRGGQALTTSCRTELLVYCTAPYIDQDQFLFFLNGYTYRAEHVCQMIQLVKRPASG